MNNKNLFVLILAVAVLGAGGYLLLNTPDKSSQPTTSQNATVADSETYKEYAALQGDAYDRLFIANMMAHHEGAIEMANLTQTNAKHQELKDLGTQIVLAQQTEITNMEAWQTMWGYPASSGEMMVDHSSMMMSDDMAGMTAELENKTGDEFDASFLRLMIEHHQGAIDMARPGATNAKHQEIKDLSTAIVSDQTKEIAQMKQWQQEWGY